LRRVLVASQVALSLVLLFFGAILFIRSLHNLLTIDPGFQPGGLTSVNLDFSKASYPKERRSVVWREVYDRLSAIPGVVSVAQVSIMPVSGSGWDNPVGVDGAPAATSGKEGFFNWIGPGYFRTMGTPMLAGRDFSDQDAASSPKVAIVDEAFAHTFHMTADAGKAEPVIQIVGLVRNSKYTDVREDFKPLIFLPIAQTNEPGLSATFVLRIANSPAAAINAAKASIAAMSSSIGIEFRPLSAQIADSLLRDRLMAILSVGFGFLASLLAALGLYGVIAYMVVQRRNEIGIRIALGADRQRVILLILREAVQLVGLGLACGIALALFAGKGAATLLYGVQSHDTVSLIAGSALLAAISLLASYLPAKRAVDINPTAALRNE
jgi:putative ABC transport system permease protein